jgi:hypothetical protein
MPWYLIGFNREEMGLGKGDNLEQLVQMIWESNGKPIDFALFGTHEVGNRENLQTFYYLSPEAHKYCSDGILTGWQPRVLHEKPVARGASSDRGRCCSDATTRLAHREL